MTVLCVAKGTGVARKTFVSNRIKHGSGAWFNPPTADEAEVLTSQIAGDNDATEDYQHQPSNTDARIEGVERSIPELDESVKGDLAGTKRSLTADETLAAKLAEIWDGQSSEREPRRKSRAEEILAIHEAIKLLNDDDALELFKATLTNSLPGGDPSKHRCGGQTTGG